MTETEIQYLASVGRSPSVPVEAHTGVAQWCQTGIFRKFPEIENFANCQGQTMGSTIENTSEMVFSDQLRLFPLTTLDLSTLYRPV